MQVREWVESFDEGGTTHERVTIDKHNNDDDDSNAGGAPALLGLSQQEKGNRYCQ
jgi:hypothetical protein